MKTSFWQRLVRWNAPFIVHVLKTLAKAIEGMYPGPAVHGLVFFYENGDNHMGEITVQDDHAPLNASVSFLDAKGAPVTPDDVPAWSSSDDTVASVAASADGMSASVTFGVPGAAVIQVSSVEANTGAQVIAQGTVTVQPGDTAIGEVTFSE